MFYVSTYSGKVIEYLTKFSLKIYLNPKEKKKKPIEEFGCILDILGKPSMSKI
jgi:hypothetical protein